MTSEDMDLEKVSSMDTVAQSSESSPPSTPIKQPDRVLHGWRLNVVTFCLFFGLLLSQMESSIVATSLLDIAHAFDDFIRIQWVVLAYLLTYMGFALLSSRLSDVIGRKWITFAAFIVFSAFSLGCGLSQTLDQLIAFRALQGIGGSALYAMTMTVLPEITPKERFPLMSGGIGIVFTVAAVLGPLLGGVITTHSTWRWIFLLNVPCGVVAMILILIAWPKITSVGKIPLKRLDFVGATLFLVFSVFVVFVMEEGGAGIYAWSSATIIAMIVVAATALLVFGAWIWYFSTHSKVFSPIFPAHFLTNRIMLVIMISTALTGFTFYTILIELPERFQLVNNDTPERAGVHLLPILCLSALGSGLGGFLSSKKNYSFYTLTAANSFILLGVGLLSTLPDSRSIPARQYGFQCIFGIGVGLTFSSVTVMTKLQNKPRDQAAAQGLVAQLRIFGGSVGLAAATIVLNNRLVAQLHDVLSPSQLSGLRQSLSSIETFTPMQKGAVVVVFADAFSAQLRIATIIAGVSLLACLCGWQKQFPGFENWDHGVAQMVESKKANDVSVPAVLE